MVQVKLLRWDTPSQLGRAMEATSSHTSHSQQRGPCQYKGDGSKDFLTHKRASNYRLSKCEQFFSRLPWATWRLFGNPQRVSFHGPVRAHPVTAFYARQPTARESAAIRLALTVSFFTSMRARFVF